MASTIDAFLTGSIGGSDGIQGKWIQSLGLNPEKTIVLTHHNGFSFNCSSVSPLWAEINGALKGDPYAWYWGHIHNGIVYDSPVTITPDGSSKWMTKTYSRCLGHAALPYGLSSELDSEFIAWNATNPQEPKSSLLSNGYAVLTLTKNSAYDIIGITENFYDLTTNTAVWTKQIY
jgi:hypothetical protein